MGAASESIASESAVDARHGASGPSLAPDDECGCRLAPAPNAPADRVGSCADERARDKRTLDASDGFATWIADASFAVDFAPPSIDLPPPLGPPGPPARTASTVALSRLVDRGVLGLLSEICTVRL
jgi:hypothetical protein